MKDEIYKEIPGYEGLYEISNLGNVRSLNRTVVYSNGHIQKITGKQMSKVLTTWGYYQIGLTKNKIRKKISYT